jgi:hypothetical protein
MLNFKSFRLILVNAVLLTACGPAPDEVSGGMSGELSYKVDSDLIGRQTRPVTPNSYTNPLEVRYSNNGSEVRMNFDLAASELDLNFSGERKRDLGNVYTFEDVNRLVIYYRLAQENIGSNNLEIAEFNTNEALKIVRIPELLNMKGTLYFLNGDTANANIYWTKSKTLTDSLNTF